MPLVMHTTYVSGFFHYFGAYLKRDLWINYKLIVKKMYYFYTKTPKLSWVKLKVKHFKLT